MIRFLLLLAFLSVCGTALSQKIVKDEKDAFTGSHVIETSYTAISDGFNCSLRIVNDTRTLLAVFNCDDNVYTMEEGAEFMLKLQNDSIITLQNLKYSVAEYWSTSIGRLRLSHFNLNTKYILSDEQIKQLQTMPITVVRFYTTDGYIERKVSGKNSKKILKLFNLIKI